jgi:hypothetical protein
MKVRVKKVVEFDVASIKIDIPVRYGNEDIPEDFPFRVKAAELEGFLYCGDYDRWIVIVDVAEKGARVRDWPEGQTGDFCMKVCDEGFYCLLDSEGAVVARREENYVPNRLLPPNDGWGDYVELKIDEDGKIVNWPKRPDFSQFFS